jgi:two-component sensor histidine kinase/DNA-binding response OmpR family regulator
MIDKVNVLLVDDQPAKLLANEEILRDLGENLVKASSAHEALDFLLKNEAAVVLIDVCMPDLDGFQLAAMIREHPRFQKTAIIFISAVLLTDVDRLRGYQMGAVDYVPVPVVPEVLRAKVKVFAELYRKTRELERLNVELERRVAERTAELEASNARLLQSEQSRSLALASGQMGSWDWDIVTGEWRWDEGQHHIFGIQRNHFKVSLEAIRALIHPEDWMQLEEVGRSMSKGQRTHQVEFRVLRPDGNVRWCFGTAAATFDAAHRLVRMSGVTTDITDRKEAEERQILLAREVDHRARNALAVIQSIIRLSRAVTVDEYVQAIEGRIKALARAHTLLSDSRWQGADLATLVAEELAPYRQGDRVMISGPDVSMPPSTAQGLALALHELATNTVKHGALSTMSGKLGLSWQLQGDSLTLQWKETGGPTVAPPAARNFGLKVILASIEQQLDGQVAFDWDPQGLRCALAIPRSKFVRPRAAASPPAPAHVNGAAIGLESDRKPRVLLVEDEALVAMLIQDSLSEFGFQVIGPVSTASDALEAANDGHFDAAVLDINLGDDTVYNVAERLAKRGIPFVFVTGYDADSVDSRFGDVPILQKPIERETLKEIFVRGNERTVAPPALRRIEERDGGSGAIRRA